MKSLKTMMLGALAALRGEADYHRGMGFLPTRAKLGLPEEGSRGDFCVETSDGELVATNVDLRAARGIARTVRNQPGSLRRGARVRNQRTGEILLSGVGRML